MTKTQAAALKWLSEHNGEGTFNKTGVLLAAGELGPFTRRTWNRLRDAGKVEIYKPRPRGASRIRVLR